MDYIYRLIKMQETLGAYILRAEHHEWCRVDRAALVAAKPVRADTFFWHQY